MRTIAPFVVQFRVAPNQPWRPDRRHARLELALTRLRERIEPIPAWEWRIVELERTGRRSCDVRIVRVCDDQGRPVEGKECQS